MIERKIKELSIAFEALSRINDPDAAQCISDVSDLLKVTIKEAKEQYKDPFLNMPLPFPNDDDVPF